jgi:hypothetical protein
MKTKKKYPSNRVSFQSFKFTMRTKFRDLLCHKTFLSVYSLFQTQKHNITGAHTQATRTNNKSDQP